MLEDKNQIDLLYKGYTTWKGWNKPRIYDAGDDVYNTECQRGGLCRNGSILELGFGRGDFLTWANNNGHHVVGIELIPELVEHARNTGHDVILCDGRPPVLDAERMFDLIVAFDVFEHLTVSELYHWLCWMRDHLKENGRIVARFPNGGSPFGRLYQSSDLTHKSTLSAIGIDQIARQSQLKLVAHYNAARPARGSGLTRLKFLRRLTYLVRDVIEIFIGYIYFGHREPLDPNLTIILSRA